MWKKVCNNFRQNIKDITLTAKVCTIKANFPFVTYICESWTMRKVEQRKIMTLNHDARKISCTVEE